MERRTAPVRASNDRSAIPLLAALLGFSDVSPDWSGIDAVLPMLERMRLEGCVVLVKLDGERTGAQDSGPYTVVASGKPLGDDFLRIDERTLEDALAHVIVRYAARMWGYREAATD